MDSIACTCYCSSSVQHGLPIKKEKMFRVQRQNSAAQLQICSSTQLHYRRRYNTVPTIKLTRKTLGNQLGNTRRTMTGVGLTGMVTNTRLYSTYWKFG